MPKDDPHEGYRKGVLEFELEGEKLHGGWTLVKSHGSKYGGDKSWLLIKENDAFARPGSEGSIVDERPESVLSGRTLEAIARDPDRVWHLSRIAVMEPGMIGVMEPVFEVETDIPVGVKNAWIWRRWQPSIC